MKVKVLRRDLMSISPARAYCEGRKIAGPLQYQVGKWIKALPGSIGILLFEVDDAHLGEFLERWGDDIRAFECEATGLRPVLVVISPTCSSAVKLSAEDAAALKSQSGSLLSGAAFYPAPNGRGYRTIAADRIRLIRELT